MNYKSIPLSTSVFYKDQSPIFGEATIIVSVDDNAGGAHIVLSQVGDEGLQKIELDLEQLELVVVEAGKLIKAHDANEKENIDDKVSG